MRRPAVPTPLLLITERLGGATCSGLTFGGILGDGGKVGDGGKGGVPLASSIPVFSILQLKQ